MSTAFEWRDLGLLQPRDVVAEEPREWSNAAAASQPAAGERRVQTTSRAVTVRLRLQLNRARVVAAIIVALSILGLVYLTQISHVARYGYLLSDLQRQQVRVERENQLLEYQITTAHSLGQLEALAERTYGMEPLVKYRPIVGKSGTTVNGDKNAPQARYVTVQRPVVATPALAPPPAPLGPLDRLANRLIGIGVASAERR